MIGLLGMLTGAGAYVVGYRWALPFAGMWGDRGELTFPDVAGASPWIWIPGLAAIALILSALSRASSIPIDSKEG